MRVDLINFVNNKIYISVSVTIKFGILSKITKQKHNMMPVHSEIVVEYNNLKYKYLFSASHTYTLGPCGSHGSAGMGGPSGMRAIWKSVTTQMYAWR